MKSITKGAGLVCLATVAALTVTACASRPKPMGPAATKATPASPEQPYAPPNRNESPITETEQGAPVPGSERDFVINAGDRIYFDLDSYTMRSDARPVLDAQAAWLSRYPGVRVRVEGNCDERGTREYNFALGARRAATVRDYLVAHGIAPGRVDTVSYGKEHPIDVGEDEQAWAHNRNAHTAITAGAR